MSGWGPKVLPITGSSSPAGDNSPINVYIYQIPYPTANVELSQALPANTRKIYIADSSLRSKMRISFTAGGTNSSEFITIHPGNSFLREGMKFIGKTLYFQASKSNLIIELSAWA